MPKAFTNTLSRVWFQEGGAGPSRSSTYHGNWKAGAISWDLGDITTIREPDPNSYNKFTRVARYRGEPGDPELPITARYTMQRSVLLKAARANCDHTLRVAMGECQNPQDSARGWDKLIVLEGASISSYGTEDIGALSPDENSPVNEEVPFTGLDLYEVTRLSFAEMGPTTVTREIAAVYVCDQQQCGACGVATDGCQVVLAVERGNAASPGLLPSVLYTRNGGGVWGKSNVTSMAANRSADFIFCAGSYAIVLSDDSVGMHYCTLADLLVGAPVWTAVTNGFVAAKGPVYAYSFGASDSWICGSGGYIYHTTNPTDSVTVSDAGNATTEDLNCIHGFDELNLVAVGAANAVVRTTNGGETWGSVTGPAVGVVLNTVWMRSATEWIVGAANGRAYYTLDGGVTWTEKGFSGSGTGSVRSIVFTTQSIGYMAHSTATPAGRLLRTIDGGNTWYVLPEGAGSIPANDYIGHLSTCDDPNIVFGGGLADNASDGFLVKAS